MNLVEAAKFLGVTRQTVWRWVKTNKIKIKKSKKRGILVSKEELIRVAKQITESSEEKELKDDEELEDEDEKEFEIIDNIKGHDDEIIRALNLNESEKNRVMGILKGIKKSDAEILIKTETALSKMRENLMRNEKYVSIEDMEIEFEEIFEEFFRSLKDLFETWRMKYSLKENQISEMTLDYKMVACKTLERLKSKCTEN